VTHFEMDKIHLPDGEYIRRGGGYRINIHHLKIKGAAWTVVIEDGIRGAWDDQILLIQNGKIVPYYTNMQHNHKRYGPDHVVYKIFTNDLAIIRNEKINKIIS